MCACVCVCLCVCVRAIWCLVLGVGDGDGQAEPVEGLRLFLLFGKGGCLVFRRYGLGLCV